MGKESGQMQDYRSDGIELDLWVLHSDLSRVWESVAVFFAGFYQLHTTRFVWDVSLSYCRAVTGLGQQGRRVGVNSDLIHHV